MSEETTDNETSQKKHGCLKIIMVIIIIAILYNIFGPSDDSGSRARIDAADKAIKEWNETATPEQRRAVENFGN